MELWVGPAIIAALVSALISAAGWFVTSWQAQRSEARRRGEKVHDFQVALRAEIASDLLSLEAGDRSEMLESVASALANDAGYQPFVPRLAGNIVFEQVVKEIHVLPGDLIGAVIAYERLRQSIEHFVDDIRDAAELSPQRKLLMMGDYFDMLDRLEALARNAVSALDASLLNKQDAAQPTQGSASGPALAEPSASSAQSSLP